MAISKRVIILETLRPLEPGSIVQNYVLWADVPTARQPFYASPGAVSAWKGASGPDNAAIAAGEVAERVGARTWASGTSNATMQSDLQAIWTAYNTEIQNNNPWVRYGKFMDTSNGWTPGGVS